GLEVALHLDAHFALVGAHLALHLHAGALRVDAQPPDVDRGVDRLLLEIGGEVGIDRPGKRDGKAGRRKAHLLGSSWAINTAIACRERALPNVSSGMATPNSSSRESRMSSAAAE